MSVIVFQKPEKVIMHKASEFQGSFEFKPLEPGYGVTIGNALRRILLSSLQGYAISSIRVPGVDHEFSTIKGVVEDVIELILNLKQVRFKPKGEGIDGEKLIVILKGKGAFTAGDIEQFSSNFKVLNPDLVLCTMDGKMTLELELTIRKGRGYVAAEDNKTEDAPLGVIPVDSVFTPIKNVSYLIENTRVEQKTDYEKLLLDVVTDGSIHPEDALKEAARILIQHFALFSDETMALELASSDPAMEIDEDFLAKRKLLKSNLGDMNLSVRAFNCLKAAEIRSLADLVKFDIADLLKFRNFGKKSLTELEDLVREKGLTFGMDIHKYKLDED